jgi:hypothetical protein
VECVSPPEVCPQEIPAILFESTTSQGNKLYTLGHGHPSFQSRYTRRRMMRACGADDAEVFTPADVQKTTFSDDR